MIDNLVLVPAIPNATSIGVRAVKCSASSVNSAKMTALQNNAFVGAGTMTVIDRCVGTTPLDTPAVVNGEAFFGQASGNVALRSTCAGDTVTCGTPTQCPGNCPAGVIDKVSAAPRFGADTLFGPGWPLLATAPCLVTAGRAHE